MSDIEIKINELLNNPYFTIYYLYTKGKTPTVEFGFRCKSEDVKLYVDAENLAEKLKRLFIQYGIINAQEVDVSFNSDIVSYYSFLMPTDKIKPYIRKCLILLLEKLVNDQLLKKELYQGKGSIQLWSFKENTAGETDSQYNPIFLAKKLTNLLAFIGIRDEDSGNPKELKDNTGVYMRVANIETLNDTISKPELSASRLKYLKYKIKYLELKNTLNKN